MKVLVKCKEFDSKLDGVIEDVESIKYGTKYIHINYNQKRFSFDVAAWVYGTMLLKRDFDVTIIEE